MNETVHAVVRNEHFAHAAAAAAAAEKPSFAFQGISAAHDADRGN